MNCGAGVTVTDHAKDPIWQVFNNDLLRDLILENAIQDPDDGGVSKDQIYNCRLVSKGFLCSISHNLKKLRVPMKTLYLRYNVIPPVQEKDLDREFEELDEQQEDGEDDSYDEEDDKTNLLEGMINVFGFPHRLAFGISILPFTLFLDGNAFFFKKGQKGRNLLSNFLTSEVCSTSLIELHIWFPKSMEMETFLSFPEDGDQDNKKLVFPELLEFYVRGFGKDGLDAGKLAIIQQILNGAEKLGTFRLRNFTPPPGDLPDLLTLPRGLEVLHLETPLASGQLQEILLVRNPLHKLKTLEIYAPQLFCEKDVQIFENILDKFQENLTALFIRGPYEMKKPPLPEASLSIRIPVMKNLENLKISGVLPWHWTSGVSLAGCFPVLETLDLDRLKDTAWYKFLDGGGGYFGTVTHFKTIVCRPIAEESDYEMEEDGSIVVGRRTFGDHNLTLFQVNKLCGVFSNLQILEASIDQQGFPVLFREMRQLKILKVHVELSSLTLSALKWKIALLGITMEEVRRIKKIPRYIKYRDGSRARVKLRREEGAVSITDMSELTHFKMSSDQTPLLLETRLLTHMVFYLGLMKMAKLKTLEFHGGFKPTQEMIQRWTAIHGDTISYTNDCGEDNDIHFDDFI